MINQTLKEEIEKKRQKDSIERKKLRDGIFKKYISNPMSQP